MTGSSPIHLGSAPSAAEAPPPGRTDLVYVPQPPLGGAEHGTCAQQNGLAGSGVVSRCSCSRRAGRRDRPGDGPSLAATRLPRQRRSRLSSMTLISSVRGDWPLMKESEDRNASITRVRQNSPERKAACRNSKTIPTNWAESDSESANDNAEPPRYLTRCTPAVHRWIRYSTREYLAPIAFEQIRNPIYDLGVMDYSGVLGRCSTWMHLVELVCIRMVRGRLTVVAVAGGVASEHGPQCRRGFSGAIWGRFGRHFRRPWSTTALAQRTFSQAFGGALAISRLGVKHPRDNVGRDDRSDARRVSAGHAKRSTYRPTCIEHDGGRDRRSAKHR